MTDRSGETNPRSESDTCARGMGHELERQTWVSEIEIFELLDGELAVDRAEARGPVKNEDAIKCSCGREFRADEKGRELAAEHLRSVRTEAVDS